MKVIFIHNSVPEYRLQFMKELSKLCDVHFLITEPALAASIYGIESINKNDLNITDVKSNSELLFFIKDEHPDIVVIPPIDNFLQLVYGICALRVAKHVNSKVIYWTEAWRWGKYPILKNIKKNIQFFFMKLLCKKCDICIAAGSKSAELLHSFGINHERIKLAYDSSTSPVCTDYDIRGYYSIPLKSKVVLYLGRIVKRKGLDYLLKAFSELDNNTFLLVGGEGEYLSRCNEIVDKLNMSDRVKFVGKIEPNSRAAYYRASDVFVLPSYSYNGTIEAWGLTVNESLEQGIPVVATNVVGSAYDLLDGNCGVMVDECNITELKNAIEHFLYCDSRDIRMKCKEQYSKYNVPNMALGFFKAFKTAL